MEIRINKEMLERAIRRSRKTVRNEALIFMRDTINAYWRAINNTPPWRMGASGGGVPVAIKMGGNLRKSHQKKIKPLESKIWVNEKKADYAKYVHSGTYKMHERPWLVFATDSMARNVQEYQQRFLMRLAKDLAS